MITMATRKSQGLNDGCDAVQRTIGLRMIELSLVVLAPRLKNRKNRPSNNNWALQILKDSHLASLCCGAEIFFK